jgi:cytochrome c peroxidase
MRLAIILLLASIGAAAAPHHLSRTNLAPGYGELEFVLPSIGSYKLPGLGQAADSKVVTSRGEQVNLYDLMGDKFTLLSFIYTRCSDVNGCPLASFVLSKVQDRVLSDEILNDYVRLVSISFDPANDTPEVLANYAASFRKPGFDWRFVTTNTPEDMAAVLRSYDQFVIRDYDDQGKFLGSISHMLRVYLIDHNHEIRNIYSVSYLHPDTIMNDIRTIVAGATADNHQDQDR